MYVKTRAKIRCGPVTPYWCWVPIWLSFPCNVFSIWRPSNQQKSLPPPSQEPLALPRAFVMRPPFASYRGQISWRRGSVPPAATGGRQRRKRTTSMTTATTNTSTGVSEFASGGYWGWATAEIAMQRQRWRQGGRIASHPTDYGDAGAGGKATFGGIPYASEASLSNVDDANGRWRQRQREMDHPMMMKKRVMLANYGLMPLFF